MTKKIKSIFDQIARNPKHRENINKEYKDLLIAELILAAKSNDTISVIEFVHEANASITIMKELKS